MGFSYLSAIGLIILPVSEWISPSAEGDEGCAPSTSPAFLSEKSGTKELDFQDLLWVFVLAFMARKRACFRGRLNLLFLVARPRKLKRHTAALATAG